MLTLHAVQAQFGDSLILEFGMPAKRRFLLIDGGPPDNFKSDLEHALRDIVGHGGRVDLLVLSHIDNDHVIGVLDLLAALEEDDANGLKRRIGIGGLWHNSFQHTIDRDGEITERLNALMTLNSAKNIMMPLASNAFFGVREGHRLRILAKKLGIAINKGFSQDLILVETAKKPIRFGPLTLRVVGPNKPNLDALRQDWLKWIAKTEQQAGTDPSTLVMSDKSVPNLSSIVIHAECQGKTILLTGDARGDHIIDGLTKAGLAKNGKLHVTVLKVQHHGSDRNATRRFFDSITADTYVLSANGKYDNPDYDTLKWMVESAHATSRPITIVVTNDTASLKKLRKTHPADKHGYTLTVKARYQHSIPVVLVK